MPVVDLTHIPDILKTADGSLDLPKALSVLGLRSRSSLTNAIFYLYLTDPQVSALVLSKLAIAAVAHVNGQALPEWSTFDVDEYQFYKAEALCKSCVESSKSSCFLEGNNKFIWCEAYRLAALDLPVEENDIKLLQDLAKLANVSDDFILPLGGYVEELMFNERREKAVAILKAASNIEATDDAFYNMAKTMGLHENLNSDEFKKIYNLERFVRKYLVTSGEVVLDAGKFSLRPSLTKSESSKKILGDILVDVNVPKESDVAVSKPRTRASRKSSK